jgi:hypothetical protein
MTENTDSDDSSNTNISQLREMALRGDDYREVIEFTYYDDMGELYIRPLQDEEFLPIAAFLEERLDLDPEEAQEALEDGKDESGGINPGQFDEAFVEIMQNAAVMGIDRNQGIAEGEDKEGIRELVGMLQGGKSLIIAERVLEISSNAEKAESFRRDGGGE